MKKTIVLLLAVIMVIAAAACSVSKEKEQSVYGQSGEYEAVTPSFAGIITDDDK